MLKRLWRLQLKHSLTKHALHPIHDTNVIYVVFHKTIGRCYVGETSKSAFERFQRHSQNSRKWALFKHKEHNRPLYWDMAKYGHESFIMFPIEQLPRTNADTDKTQRLARERFWTHILQAHVPTTGYNSQYRSHRQSRNRFTRVHNPMLYMRARLALHNTPPPTPPPPSPAPAPAPALNLPPIHPSRMFLSRCFTRRLLHIDSLMSRGIFSSAYLHRFNTSNIVRMKEHLLAFPTGIAQPRLSQIAACLKRELRSRFELERVDMSQPHVMLVSVFHNSGLDRIPLQRIIKDKEIHALLPLEMRKFRISAVWKYVSTLGYTTINCKHTARLPQDTIANIHAQPCPCNDPHYAPYVHPQHGHVLTSRLDIPGLPADFASLMHFGTKFRMQVEQTEDTTCSNLLTQALQSFCNKMYDLGMAAYPSLNPWAAAVFTKCRPFLPYAQHAPNTHTVPQASVLLLRRFQKRFVVTTMDKASNTFVIVCKKHYVSSITAELHAPAATYTVCNTAPKDIVAQHLAFLKTHDIKGTPGRRTARLPTFQAIVKMHKTPPTFRFIANSSATSLEPLSRLLTSVFKFVSPDVERMWCDVVKPHLPHNTSSWILTDSTALTHTINALNRTTRQHENTPVSVFDFSTLYTKIDLHDLKARLTTLIDAIFVKKCTDARKPHMFIKKTGSTLSWVDRVDDDSQDDSFEPKEHSLHLSKAQLVDFLCFLVDNIYVVFGDTLYKQDIGIPMGTNCAVFLANFYLFTYELDFVRKLIAHERIDVLVDFQFTRRYIDDLISLHNPRILSHLYLEDCDFGLYPKTSLQLNPAGSSPSVPYLDLHITCTNHGIHTTIYNKLDTPTFNTLDIVRFPHHDSFISRTAKYGIMTSQMHSYQRKCSTLAAFTTCTARLAKTLLNKGYSFRLLHHKMHSFLATHPHIYRGVHSSHILSIITKKINTP
eukprot:comp24335_c0_seq5/m.46115 comp24335_c0_seq5/g.46115  ORF comp24335_c0_seq5/g.46115 comp24335_c0_seq5/m.46115 type:complete len:939 (-) comp24335_c0_seq5:29-2845(-)